MAKLREKHDVALLERTDVRVWLRLLSCSMIIEKRLRRRFVEQFDTTLPRFDVLAAIERHPDGTAMGELSRSLLVSNGNVTALVRQLERDGYVASRSAEGDRRSSVVQMTPAGRTHFDALARAHHGWIAGMFAEMSLDDKLALHELLANLKSSIAADEGEMR